MTKKFWNDWKCRVGETEQVYLARGKANWRDYENSLRYSKDLVDSYRGERILSYKFNGDTVDIVVERKIYVEDDSWFRYHYETKNECVTLKRKDIVSVEFKRK